MINIFLPIFLVVQIICILFGCIMCIRNIKVYKIRGRILDLENGLELHRFLPSYNTMLNDFKTPLTYQHYKGYAEKKRMRKLTELIRPKGPKEPNEEPDFRLYC